MMNPKSSKGTLFGHNKTVFIIMLTFYYTKERNIKLSFIRFLFRAPVEVVHELFSNAFSINLTLLKT